MEIPKTGGALNVNQTADGPSGAGDVPDFEMPDMDQLKGGDQKYYFQLMQKMQAESRAFETMTNILKAKDDAAKSAIRNIGH